MLYDKKKNQPFCRLEAFHGKAVFPRARAVHQGKRVIGQSANFSIPQKILNQGLYGAMIQHNEPMISNDCENDARHIKLPNGHRPMINLLGLPLWVDSEVEAG